MASNVINVKQTRSRAVNDDVDPLVTIITVTKNNGRLLARCIQSVRDQTYSNIEYIVIDGASTDSTPSVIEKYRSIINHYVSEEDAGIYHAMNKGLALATGEYVIFLNSDDWYKRYAIEKLVLSAKASHADITHANAILVNDRNRVIGRLQASLSDSLYTRGATIRHETMMVSREVYESVGSE